MSFPGFHCEVFANAKHESEQAITCIVDASSLSGIFEILERSHSYWQQQKHITSSIGPIAFHFLSSCLTSVDRPGKETGLRPNLLCLVYLTPAARTPAFIFLSPLPQLLPIELSAAARARSSTLGEYEGG